MKESKFILILLATVLANNISAQTAAITKILQKTLQQEIEARKMVYTEIDSAGNKIGMSTMDIDSLVVTEPFIIKNDTLYYTTKHHFAYEKGYYTDQQIVALKDISAVAKDIGIFFETAPDKVQIIRQEYFEESNSIKTSRKTDLFRTHFISLRDNEYLADDLVKAFKKAGYKIEKGYWYD
ncbi:hypothetical protein [Flavobacterium sp. MK4S-17]|uniref:hypothetical protein n=1 Tax=Flavobacterium sp. MK4S-17 TaxID=2543737 RepID=UPI0013594582|nr:hypothetical protein [Flavobacterium sp. MK4S-17]